MASYNFNFKQRVPSSIEPTTNTQHLNPWTIGSADNHGVDCIHNHKSVDDSDKVSGGLANSVRRVLNNRTLRKKSQNLSFLEQKTIEANVQMNSEIRTRKLF